MASESAPADPTIMAIEFSFNWTFKMSISAMTSLFFIILKPASLSASKIVTDLINLVTSLMLGGNMTPTGKSFSKPVQGMHSSQFALSLGSPPVGIFVLDLVYSFESPQVYSNRTRFVLSRFLNYLYHTIIF